MNKSRFGISLCVLAIASVLVQTCVALSIPFSSYMGGTNEDHANAVAVDSQGNTYVVGSTTSANFPLTTNALDKTLSGEDVFIMKIGTNGQLVFSTLLGGIGNDRAYGVALDALSNVYVTGVCGSGSGFTQVNGFVSVNTNGNQFAFVTKIGAKGTNILYSTFLGGSGGDEEAHGIAVDGTGFAYVVGFTDSTNILMTNALQSTNTARDAFIFKIHPSGTSVVFSTYLGASGIDAAMGVSVDAASNVYLVGDTDSSDFPTTNALDSIIGGGNIDSFVAKVSAGGTNLVFSTFYGGSSEDHLNCIALDAATNVYFAGYGQSFDIPLISAVQTNFGGYIWDGYIAALRASGTQLLFSTFYGGDTEDLAFDIDVDSAGNIVVVGNTASVSFPVVGGRPQINGVSDAFVLKLLAGGRRVLLSTYLGGDIDESAHGVAVQRDGTVHVVGDTSSLNYPVANAIQSTNASAGGTDGFVTRIANEPVVMFVSNSTAGVIAGWNTYSGMIYKAQSNSNVLGGTWADLGLPVTALVGSCCMSVTQSTAAVQRFFRVAVTNSNP